MENGKIIFQRLLEIMESGETAVLYTLIDAQGCPGLKEGARLLVCPGGKKYGTLGEESLDREMMARAEGIFKRSAPNTGLIESNVKILEDSYFPQKKLVVFGGGHVALPLVEMAAILGYMTVVVDDRPEFANKERFPQADEIICSRFEEVLQKGLPGIDSSTSVVLVTRGHKYDELCLKYVIRSKARYIGMIGSSSKVRQIFATLLREGVNKEDLKKVSAPIGLDLGGQKPAEIALSILAEIVARENSGTGRPLKELKAGVLP